MAITEGNWNVRMVVEDIAYAGRHGALYLKLLHVLAERIQGQIGTRKAAFAQYC